MRRMFRVGIFGRFMVPLMLWATLATAQMGGILGGYGGMMGGSLGGMAGGSLSGMMGVGSGLTIGPDGTLYITRSTTPEGQSTQAPTVQLAAVDANGNPMWTLPINSSSASQPVLAKNGTLFLTTSDWFDWMYNRGTPVTQATANLLIVKPGNTSATVVAILPLAGQVASAPQIATDTAGNSVVYVVTVDGFSRNVVNSATSTSYLYAFTLSGSQKYRLQLSHGGSGMMGF